METLVEELELEQQTGEREEKRTPGRRARTRLVLAFAGGLVAAAAVGTGMWLHFRNRVSTDDAQVDGHLAPVAPKISGNVVAILVDDNQPVKAGQVLVRIDPRDYQAKVDQAKAALAYAESRMRGAQVMVPLTAETTGSGTSGAAAQLAAAQAEYDRAKLTYEKSASSELAYARANVEAQRATYERASADLSRMRPLVAKAEISQQQFDAYVAAERVAQSQWKAVQERLAAAGQEVRTNQAAQAAAGARVEQMHAALAQARANLEAAELELSYTTITAPIDGVVTRKVVQLGQIVQPGQDLLVIVP